MTRPFWLALAAGVCLTSVALAQDASFEITAREVVAERDRPQACFSFSERLLRPGLVRYGRYVQVEPAVPVETVVRDRSLCIEGLAHGTTYKLTLKEGLPSASGRALAQPVEETVEVPNRQPALAFRGTGYVLSQIGPEGLPLRSVNVAKARLQILRIKDRNLVERIYFGRLSQSMSEYDIGELIDKSAEQVWQGEMAIEGGRNVPAVTPFPIEAVLGGLEPGVYIAVAANAETPNQGWQGRASQWFIVSDLGLTTFEGGDGLLVFARSIASGEPLANAELRLLARSGRELGKAETGPDGTARFDSTAVGGAGDAAPQALFAHGPSGAFSFLDMGQPAFDLTRRGGDGREAPGARDAYVFADRGTYRPGETAHLTVLLRDADAKAVPGQTLTLRLVRPDGQEVLRREVPDAGAGGHAVSLTLPATAMPGRWTVAVHVDPARPPVGHVGLAVDDVAPALLELALTPGNATPGSGPAAGQADARPTLQPGAGLPLDIEARHIHGAAGSGLPGELSMLLRPAETPFPQFAGFQFGLVQEEPEPRRQDLPGFTTDARGRARVQIALDGRPETSRPLEAVLRAVVYDVGGRPAGRELVLPVRSHPVFIGIRPRFDGDGVPDGATAGFDVIAVSPDGARVALPALRYEVFEEAFEFSWFEAGGRWDYKRVVTDRRVGGGDLAVAADAPAVVEQTVAAGRYRIEVFDPQTGAATSVRFAAGWWAQPLPSDKPDQVDVVAMMPAYKPGQSAWVYVRPPYQSQVLLALADRNVRQVLTRQMGPEGGFFEIPVSEDWMPGINVVATAFAVGEPSARAIPRRAIGMGWIGLDPAPRVLSVGIDAPAQVRPRARADVSVRVDGAEPGATVMATLTAVDGAALGTSGETAPEPVDHFLGRRRLGVEIRDLYGRLVEPAETRTRTRAAGGRARPAVAPTARRQGTIISLFSGVVRVGDDGMARIPLDLPDFDGRLHLMAMAWSGDKVGQAETSIEVRDPVVADLVLPRFLAPGDTARVQLNLRNVSGPVGDYTVSLEAADGLTVADGRIRVVGLTRGKQVAVTRELQAGQAGAGDLRLMVTAPDGSVLERRYTLPVRPPEPTVLRRAAGRLQPDQRFTPTAELAEGLRPETVSMAASVGPGPLLGLPGVLADLDRYAYGAADQVGARALPLMGMLDTAAELGLGTEPQLRERVQRSVDRLAGLQRPDGAFALWSPRGPAERWLTAFAVDVLGRARQSGYQVSEAAIRQGQEWLTRMLDNSWVEPTEVPARAYAYYVLARSKAIEAPPVRFFAETYGQQLQTDLARAQVAAAFAHLGDARRAQQFAEQIQLRRTAVYGVRDYGSTLRDVAAAYVVLAESNALPADRLTRLAEQLAALAGETPVYSAQEAGWLLRAARLVAERGGEMQLAVNDQPATVLNRPLYRRLDPSAPALDVVNAGQQTLNQMVTVVGVPQDPLSADRNGMAVERRILDMTGKPADLSKVKRNDLLVVVLEGSGNEGEVHQALIVDRLPAGFEVEAVRVAGSAQLGGLSWLGELSEAQHVDYRDDRFVAAVELGPLSPTFRLVYVVRAVTSGDYALPATQLEDAWRPTLFARGTPGRVRIVD
ncbi:MAG TPA: alpha-2-macroglobulin [Azospirillaceae bacterium]|nr:alpha-2-macroglobulin [Azospirillaceae bacterium]